MTADELRNDMLLDLNQVLGISIPLHGPLLRGSQRTRAETLRNALIGASEAMKQEILSHYPSERTMAVVNIEHEIPDSLVLQAAAFGITWEQIAAWVKKDGPLVIEILTDFFAMLQGHASVQAMAGSRPFIHWLITAVVKYGPTLEKVLVVLLPLLGL